MPFETVNPEQYPLLRNNESLAEAYNRLVRLVNRIDESKRKLFDGLGPASEELAAADWEGVRDPDLKRRKKAASNFGNRLIRCWELLRRNRYNIGFVGRSRCGKSSTVNEVLGEIVLPEGTSQAGTSTATRLQFVGQKGTPELHLRYMTREEFDDRIRYLAVEAGYWSVTEGDVRRTAEDYKTLLTRCTAQTPGDDRTKANRLAYLLRSGADHAQVFGKRDSVKGMSTRADLGKELRAYVLEDHAASSSLNASSDRVLLAEATAVIPCDVPATIELIDLPGLGAANIEHDALTLQFMKNLDGLLLFVTSENVDLGSSDQLMKAFRDEVDRPEERVWMAVTKFDSIMTQNQEEFYYGRPGNLNETIYACVDRVLKKYNLSTEQVCFVCVAAARDWRAQHLTGAVTPESVAKTLKLHYPIREPDAFKNGYAEFEQMFRELTSDGGMARIRTILEKTLSDRVRRQVWESVRKELSAACEALLALLRSARSDYHVVGGPLLALVWQGIAVALRDEVDDVPDVKFRTAIASEINTHGRALADRLFDLLGQMPIHVGTDETQDDLIERHRHITTQLSEAGLKRLTDEGGVIDLVFAAAARRLEQLAGLRGELNGGAGPKMPPGVDPLKQLESASRQLRANPDRIAKDFESLTATDLFETTADDDPLSTPIYEAILRQKLHVVAHQVMHRVANEVKNACDKLYGLLKVAAARRDVDSEVTDLGWFDATISDLESILAELKGLTYSTDSSSALIESSRVAPEVIPV